MKNNGMEISEKFGCRKVTKIWKIDYAAKNLV